MNLMHAYESAITSHHIQADAAQRALVVSLNALSEALEKPKVQHWWSLGKPALIKGLYLYGPVGRGKTFLMDLFYQSLAMTQKARFHFHHFMQMIDAQLREKQGLEDPMVQITNFLASQYRVICLDEFMVQDITQASLLVDFLHILFQKGVVLVATANVKPDDLYKDGINRERFLPAIAWIHQYCEVRAFFTDIDYRALSKQVTSYYFYPLNQKTKTALLTLFASLETVPVLAGNIIIQRREIAYVAKGGRTIWFTFEAICQIPRSQLDYLELANQFDIFIVSDVTALRRDTGAVLLFIYLVDVLYDRKKRLIISSEVEIEALYQTGPMMTQFARTKSRLLEMQTPAYVSKSELRSLRS